jgi:drug/metabolite transporter (DMT)-like permease
MTRARADASLLLVALLWGTTFVAQKAANAHVGPIFFVAVRFLAAAVFLLPLALWEARRAAIPLVRADWNAAAWIGGCLCAGCWIQQTGLQTTSATNAGFLTSVYLVVVPLLAWVVSGRRPRLPVLIAGLVAIGGAWLLGGGGSLAQWSRGDLIILAGDVFWALHITLIAHWRGMVARPIWLSLVQCAITGIVSLPVALLWQPAAAEAIEAALPAIVYAGLFSSGVAFTLQIVAQRQTPPAEAALIMSLESVFAAAAGALWLHERLGLLESLGAALIFTGITLVEISPLLLEAQARRRRPASL